MKPRHLVLTLASSTLLSSFALACSSGVADNGGTDEGATVVEPNGTDNPGKVTVVAPNGPVETSDFLLAGAATYALGQSSSGLATGSYPVTVRTHGPTYFVTTSLNDVHVEAGKTTTVNAGLLAIDARTDGMRIYGLGQDGTDVDIGGDGKAMPSVDGTTFAALLPTRPVLAFGLADGTETSIKAGEKTTAVLRAATDRRVAHLVAPSDPPAFRSHACDALPIDRYWVKSNSRPGPLLKLAPGEKIEFGAGPQSDSAKYFVETATLRAFDLPLGARGGAPIVTKLGRIDVDDVLINSTQPRIPGTYEISRPDASGHATPSILKCAPPTKTGVDVPIGKYVVTVSYQTAEAGMKRDAYVVDVN